ncbi:hypothetical protein [Haloferula sp. A504]|uniref:hypothetical protein n=1 Tax=Haloferula sp. A504 TaxID=3373601 RepID=UPI0031C5FE76|nr:hypothetical protein [Verrucomicrobiaceae bacterium E54]
MKAAAFSTLAAVLVAAPAAHAQRFQQEAMLMMSETEFERVWIADATTTQIGYFETERGVDSKAMPISKPQAIWLIEPPEYNEAMELYQGRKYSEAREKFATVREKFSRLVELPDNHSSLAAFYEMECLRKLGDLDGLKAAREKFLPVDRQSLTRRHHLDQLELYILWEAVRVKEWSRLVLLGQEWLEKDIPGYQRAQVGYCLGLALEGEEKPIEAINAYNIGMTADTGASERITAEAARNAMRLYLDDESVKLAIKLHGTPDEDPQSAGALRLIEGASLASLYNLTLGGGTPLPEAGKKLIEYLPKDHRKKATAAPAPEKPEGDAKKPAPKKDK